MNLTLPTDSNERKEIPITSGCLAYFPAALARLLPAGGDDNIVSALAQLQSDIAAFDRGRRTESPEASADILSAVALEFSQRLHERFGAPIAPGGEHAFAIYPAALAGVARVSKAGNDKHNPGEPLHHARGKSTDHADCIVRHLMDVQDLLASLERDPVRGRAGIAALLTEVSQLCWRALALSQELHERFGAPLAPGARLPALTAEEERAVDEVCGLSTPIRTPGFPVTPGIYRDRSGRNQTVLEIKEAAKDDAVYTYPARGKDESWNLQGGYWNKVERQSPKDLVERVSDLAPHRSDPVDYP